MMPSDLTSQMRTGRLTSSVARGGQTMRTLASFLAVAGVFIVLSQSALAQVDLSCSSARECIELSQSMPMVDRANLLLAACVRWPQDLPLHLEAAQILLAADRHSDVVRLLGGLDPAVTLAASPQFQEAIAVQLARANLHLGRSKHALELVERYAADGLRDRRLSMALQLRIHILVDLGDLAEADHLLAAVSAWGLDKQQQVLIQLEFARLAVASGDGHASLDALSRCLETQPTDQVRAFRCLVLLWLGDFAEARREATTVNRGNLAHDLAAIPDLVVSLADQRQVDREAIHRQLRDFPLEQGGYLVAAADLWMRGEGEESCRTLRSGRQAARSATLLHPPWLAACH